MGCAVDPNQDGTLSSTDSLVERHSCSASELSKCNCPNDFYCCPSDNGCFKSFDDVQHTRCNASRGSACAMPGAQSSGGGDTPSTGGGRACSASERAGCNCPNDLSCCTKDGSCFKGDDVRFTMCKDDTAAACSMSGTVTPSNPTTPTNPTTNGTLPTRLRIKNNCTQPIWMAHSDNVPDTQNVKLDRGQAYDYRIPDGGLSAVRFWPKTRCDGAGHNCQMGDNGEGGGKPCPATGCQPPLDSKFEATFSAKGGAAETWYNLSQVDGYTLPFKVVPMGSGANKGSCVVSDCARLSLDQCPGDEDMSGGGRYNQYAREDLRVRDGAGKTIACMAPCKKWNYPAPYGRGQNEAMEPGLHMCCPTPIDPAKNPGACNAASSCMTSEACRNTNDPVSATRTKYVKAMHAMCPSAYSYSYDDEAGLHACPSDTAFEVTFCP
jgi:hypothetical protein